MYPFYDWYIKSLTSYITFLKKENYILVFEMMEINPQMLSYFSLHSQIKFNFIQNQADYEKLQFKIILRVWMN